MEAMVRDKKAIKSSWIATFNNLNVCTDGFFFSRLDRNSNCLLNRMRMLCVVLALRINEHSAASSSRGNNTFLFIALTSLLYINFFFFSLFLFYFLWSTTKHILNVIIIALVRHWAQLSRLTGIYDSSVVHITIVSIRIRLFGQENEFSSCTHTIRFYYNKLQYIFLLFQFTFKFSIVIRYFFLSVSVHSFCVYWHLLHIHWACVLILTVCCLFARNYGYNICFDRSIDRHIVVILHLIESFSDFNLFKLNYNFN